MEKSDILFIRACKSLNPVERIHRLYKYFYLSDKHKAVNERFIIPILADIIDAHCPFSTIEAIEMAKEMSRYEVEEQNKAILKKLAYRIRDTKVSKFDGFIRPVYFRKHIPEEA